MATANDIITSALKDLGVLERNESPQGQEALDALDLLNEMCNSWIHDGLDMEWITLTALSDVVPYPDDQLGPIRYNLGMYLAPSFDVMPSPVLVAMAQKGFEHLRRAYLDMDLLGIDSALHPYYSPNADYVNGTSF